MSDIDSWLARKYQVQSEQAGAAQTEAQGRANLANAQAANYGSEAAAREAQAYGQAAAGRGLGTYYGTQAQVLPSTAASENLLRGSQSGLYNAEGFNASREYSPAGIGIQNLGIQRYMGAGGASPGSPFTPSLTPSLMPMTPSAQPYNFNALNTIGRTQSDSGLAKGTSKVPGKGSGKVDTQPAMLAPGEAVLNKAAADHLGRSTITLLNALGRHKMGLTDQDPSQPAAAPQPGQGASQGFAGGGFMNAISASPFGDAVRNITNNFAASPNVGPGRAIGQFQYEAPPPRAPAAPAGRSDLGAPRPTERLGYARGTSKVPEKAKAEPGDRQGKATASKLRPKGKGLGDTLTPGILSAILQMGQQGSGGMPPPGPSPMPMAMPMTMPR